MSTKIGIKSLYKIAAAVALNVKEGTKTFFLFLKLLTFKER